MTQPEDIANRALDALGVDDPIGDLQEGSKPARIAVRQYGPLLRQLLRTAHWNFARKQVSMILVADGTASPPQPVPTPWIYEYLLPTDCLQVRFVPNVSSNFVTFSTYSATPITAGAAEATPAAMSGMLNDLNWSIQVGNTLTILDGDNTENVQVTATTGTTFTATFQFNHPNPFNIYATVPSGTQGVTVPLLPNMAIYPPTSGTVPCPFQIQSDIVTALWDLSQFGTVQYGLGATQTVILTNVRSAQLVYTALIVDPDEWDVLFQEAFVAILAARMAMFLVDDKKMAMALAAQQYALAKQTLTEARAANGNETWTTIDRVPDWLRARQGLGRSFSPGLAGNFCNSWTSISLGDGTVF